MSHLLNSELQVSLIQSIGLQTFTADVRIVSDQNSSDNQQNNTKLYASKTPQPPHIIANSLETVGLNRRRRRPAGIYIAAYVLAERPRRTKHALAGSSFSVNE